MDFCFLVSRQYHHYHYRWWLAWSVFFPLFNKNFDSLLFVCFILFFFFRMMHLEKKQNHFNSFEKWLMIFFLQFSINNNNYPYTYQLVHWFEILSINKNYSIFIFFLSLSLVSLLLCEKQMKKRKERIDDFFIQNFCFSPTYRMNL